MRFIFLTLLLSFSSMAEENTLADVIKNTNLLDWKERPSIKFKARVSGPSVACQKQENGSLIVTMNAHHWDAMDYVGKVYTFCRVMNECEEKIVCPSLRSYKKKED